MVSGRVLDDPGAKAAGADLHVLHGAGALFHGADLLEVRIPDPLGLVVGVAHVVSHDGPLAAHITYPGHFDNAS
jgi:hypothetical protein